MLCRWNRELTQKLVADRLKQTVRDYLMRMRDTIVAAQFPDGHWAGDWPDGKASVTNPIDEPDYKAVIATGHHLEWLAIAPPEFHPPREVVQRAARVHQDRVAARENSDRARQRQ